MKFLREAVESSAKAPKHDIIDALKKALGAPLEPRSHKNIHASDLTKENFCPRQIALMDLTGKTRKKEHVSTALKVTFDVGEVTADLFRERWMAPTYSIGDWFCIMCKQTRGFCKKPPDVDASGCAHVWKYKEVRFFDYT